MSSQKVNTPPTVVVCLQREFVKGSQAIDWPPASALIQFCRRIEPPVSLRSSEYKDLQAGNPVRYEVAEGLVAYLQQIVGWESVTIDQAFQLVDPDDGPWKNFETMHPVIARSAGRLVQSFPDDLKEMCVHVYDLAEEFLGIANGIIRMTGLKTARPSEAKNGPICLAKGLQIGGWKSVAEFAAWLSRMYQADWHTVMYAVSSGRRVGVFVVLPLSEQAYQQIVQGELHDRDLTPDHLQSPTRYVELVVLDDYSHHIPPLRVSEESRHLAQIHLMLWQMAYFTRGRLSDGPVVLAIGRIPSYLKRLRQQGFRTTGQCMSGTNYPICVLQHPEEWGGVKLSDIEKAAYGQWLATLEWYQSWNRARWEQEDRVLGTRQPSDTASSTQRYEMTVSSERAAPLRGKTRHVRFMRTFMLFWEMGNVLKPYRNMETEGYTDYLGAERLETILKKRQQAQQMDQAINVCGETIWKTPRTIEELFGQFPA